MNRLDPGKLQIQDFLALVPGIHLMHKTAYGWLVGSNPKLILDYLDWVA